MEYDGAVHRSLSLCAVALAAACSRGTAPPPPAPPAADAQLERVTLEVYRGSTRTVAARADHVTWLREQGGFEAQNVVARFPSKDGEVHVTAPRAAGAMSGQAVEASGGVHLVAPSGLVADAPRARYDAEGPSPTLSSDAGVVATARGARLEARAFTFDLPSQHATFEDARTRAGGPP